MIILLWLILAILVGAFALSKGRGFVLWTLVSLVLTPLIGFIIVAILSSSKDAERRHRELIQAIKAGKLDPKMLEQSRSR